MKTDLIYRREKSFESQKLQRIMKDIVAAHGGVRNRSRQMRGSPVANHRCPPTVMTSSIRPLPPILVSLEASTGRSPMVVALWLITPTGGYHFVMPPPAVLVPWHPLYRNNLYLPHYFHRIYFGKAALIHCTTRVNKGTYSDNKIKILTGNYLMHWTVWKYVGFYI